MPSVTEEPEPAHPFEAVDLSAVNPPILRDTRMSRPHPGEASVARGAARGGCRRAGDLGRAAARAGR